jgi:uncharacterized membrane protein HdeD (DUF308 family)
VTIVLRQTWRGGEETEGSDMQQLSPVGGMLAELTKKWWVFLVQGVIMIALAFLAFTQPTILIQIIGIYALFEGMSKIISGLTSQLGDQSRWPALIIGVLGVLLGGVILANPTAAATVLTSLVAGWSMVVGVLLVVWGMRLRQEISGEWALILLGVLAILFGLLMFANIQAGYLTLQWIFGAYMVAGGILAILLAFRIRSLGVQLGAVA